MALLRKLTTRTLGRATIACQGKRTQVKKSVPVAIQQRDTAWWVKKAAVDKFPFQSTVEISLPAEYQCVAVESCVSPQQEAANELVAKGSPR